jgi:hypothetical protein
MKQNVGGADKAIRITAALLIVILYLTNVLPVTAAVVLLTFAGIFIITSFIGVCPLYLPFGISTRKKNEQKI